MAWRFRSVPPPSWGAILLILWACACAGRPDPGATVGDDPGQPPGGEIDGAGRPSLPSSTPNLTGGGASLSPADCQRATCEQLGKECGSIVDGCGGTVDCGSCGAQAICGLVSANTCTPLSDLCVPATFEQACAGRQCGVEGDGCGATIDCGQCPGQQACGLELPFQCSEIPTSSDEQCGARIESCEQVGAECGLIGNGCGGTLDCGTCADGQGCGIAAPNRCAPTPPCAPRDPSAACAGGCGLVSNDCGAEVDGGLVDCDAQQPCASGETCGGGGTPSQCGSGASCAVIARAVACADRECGLAGDGCGGSHECGRCAAGERCEAGRCVPPPTCVPQPASWACADKNCGLTGDGCGGLLSCGSCGAYQQCGQDLPNRCGTRPPPGCEPLTQSEACAGRECGVVFDGCGTTPDHRFDCASAGGRGGCPAGEVCGARTPFQCDAPPAPSCTPEGASCAELGWQCGIAVNRCGQIFDCALEGRTCGPFETCLGGIDGPTECVGDVGDCPLCASVPSCGAQAPTRLVGRVVTPGRSAADTANQVGVPNAFVYVLRSASRGDLPPIATGIPEQGAACDRCTEQELGPVLVSAVTDATGRFALEGSIPIGSEFLLVTKVGKFRRAARVTLPPAAACATTELDETLPANPTRLPRRVDDGLAVNIPAIAISTGRIDAMECVLEKMGVSPSQFGNPDSEARVHLYRGGPSAAEAAGARIDAATPHDAELYGSLPRLRGYDLLIADCEGTDWDGEQGFEQRAASGERVRQYVNRGGRLFASHLSFSWLHENGSAPFAASAPLQTGLAAAASWDTDYLDGSNLATSGIGRISIGRAAASPRIGSFLAWMQSEGVVPPGGAPEFTITDPRSLAIALGPASEEFVLRTDGNRRVQQFSFDTPYAAPAEQTCGRVAYSGFHVAATGGSSNPFQSATFPAHCAGALTDQEKVLLYMLFDLGACIGGEPEPVPCERRDCPADGRCGVIGDGCGGLLECGCPEGEACSGDRCVGCQPRDCRAAAAECGLVGNGCGEAIDCGSCEEGQLCGAPAPNRCGPGPRCRPLTCEGAGAECGLVGDGCGGSVDCGPCPPGQLCGIERPFRCGPAPACEPRTCETAAAQCGLLGDGCGAVLDCGECPEGAVCGLNRPNRCVLVR